MREELGEVVEQQSRLITKGGQWSVGAHGAERFYPAGGHRRQDQPQLLFGVAEHLLAPRDRGMGMDHVLPVRQVRQQNPAANEPLTVRCSCGELGLDLLVGDDPVLVKIDQKHPTRLKAALLDDLVLRDVQHSGL